MMGTICLRNDFTITYIFKKYKLTTNIIWYREQILVKPGKKKQGILEPLDSGRVRTIMLEKKFVGRTPFIDY